MKDTQIADYALIGDTETAALVSRTGSIDWLCWPDFSSPACFAALLGDASNGCWQLCPDKQFRSRRSYRPHGLILETVFTTRTGKVLVTDFMPIRGKNSDIVRVVRGLKGTVSMTMSLGLRFDYGRTVPWVQHERPHSYTATAGPGKAYLRTSTEMRLDNGDIFANFKVKQGQTISLALTYASSFAKAPRPIDPQLAFKQTDNFWLKWSAQNRYSGKYSLDVERSLITLKALTYLPTGGIVAAPTTSLPEKRGGDLNWDYRYCWLRDATFTLLALLNAGYINEAAAWESWLLRAAAGDAAQMQIMYGLRGERQMPESELPWLAGYEKSSPVRIGNAASRQFQLDIYGELADALYQADRAGLHAPARTLELQQNLVVHLQKVWQQPDQGMWEERGKPQRFVYSKVMAWVAIDRAIHSVERHRMKAEPDQVEQWKALREQMHEEICRKGFNTRMNSFVAHYGAKRVDASLLLLSLVGFLPGDDPRILGTIRQVKADLMSGGLLKRNRPRSAAARQGAFVACSFWLVQAMVLAGQKHEAQQLFRRLLRLQNDVGLLSEEYSTRTRQLIGNFPQALSHIALVNAAFALESPSSTQHRHQHN